MSDNDLLTQPAANVDGAAGDLLEPPRTAAVDDGRGLAERIGRGLGAAARAAMDGVSLLTRSFRPRRRPKQLAPAGQRERLEPLLRELAEVVIAREAPVALAEDDGFWRLVREIAAIGPPPAEVRVSDAPSEAGESAEATEALEAVEPEAEKPRTEDKKKKKKKDDENETDEA